MEKTEKMKIYISGKITGLQLEEAKKNFTEVVGILEENGPETVNPMLVSEAAQGMSWETYMGIAYAILHDESIDAVYMMLDWKNSMGACIEWGWAQAAGIPVLYQNPTDRIRFGRREERSGRRNQNTGAADRAGADTSR